MMIFTIIGIVCVACFAILGFVLVMAGLGI